MADWTVINVLGQAVLLSVGLQFIGWAKHKARLAREEWEKGDGPINRELLNRLHTGVEETQTNIRAARAGLEAARDQVRREVA